MSNSVEIDALLDECRRTAASQDSVAAVLEKLAPRIPTTTSGRRDEIALFLIRHTVIIENPPVTASLDKCLDACGAESTLSACSQIFLEAASIKIESPCPLETSLRTVKRLLLTFPESNESDQPVLWMQQEKFDSFTTTSRRDGIRRQACMDSIVSMALLIPSQIANACYFQKVVLPVWSVRSRYLPRLVECALAMNEASSDPLYLHSLVPKIVGSGSSDEVAIGLYQYYNKVNPDTDWFQTTILETMQCIPTRRDVATLLRSILQHLMAKSARPETQTVESFCQETMLPYLNLVCRPILESSRGVREAFVQLSILSSTSCSSRTDTKSDRVFCYCVASLLASCNHNDESNSDESSDEEDEEVVLDKPSSVFERHLSEVASCWSENVFVKRTDGVLQHHVTNFILSAVSLLDQDKKNPFSPLVGITLNGVSVRLQSSIHDIRMDGMRVGEALARYMDQPLKFDEMNDEHEPTQKVLTVNEGGVSDEEKLIKSKTIRKNRHRKRTPQLVDPDAEYVSDDDSSTESEESGEDSDDERSEDEDDDSIWDDTDELIPYNLDDDEEDLRETATPLYLRDCVNMLRTPDTNESAASRHETSLEAVSSLVRSDPTDLPDLTSPLCNTLLSMENKFDLPNFNENLTSGLQSLVVMQPMLAGEFLINDFFGSERGLDMRLLVLRTLDDAAYELCGDKALKQERAKRKSERALPTQKVSGKRRLVPDSRSATEEIQVSADRAVASVESRTRRWGSGSRQTKPMTVVNKFGPVAPSWFYGMLSGFMKHKQKTTLWGGSSGARLLASFLIALATIVECSGLTPGTEILARDLCEFAWSFRTVDVPEVRTALLIAIANGLAVLRDDALMGVLYSLDDLPEFLRGVALEDSDETCRVIATTISSNVSQLLSSMVDGRRIESL